MKGSDELERAIYDLVKHYHPEPLETAEVIKHLRASTEADVSRSKVLYRLNLLRGQTAIAGKAVGSGKGTWVWWWPRE